MEIKHERPEWVKNYKKAPNTEIKYINGKWYLYERSTRYDPETKKSRKITGEMLGSITEHGFVPKKPRKPRNYDSAGALSAKKNDSLLTSIPPKTSGDEASPVLDTRSYEYGASLYLLKNTSELLEALKESMGDIYKEIYVYSLLRYIHHAPDRRIEQYYKDSILSEIFRHLDLEDGALSRLRVRIGRDYRDGCRDFFRLYRKKRAEDERFFFIRPLGLDKYAAFTSMEGYPVLSKIFSSVGVGVSSAAISLFEQGIFNENENIIAIVKSEVAKEDLRTFENRRIPYAVLLKNEGRIALSYIPVSEEGYSGYFDCRGRTILYATFNVDANFFVHVLKDKEEDKVYVVRSNVFSMNPREVYEAFVALERTKEIGDGYATSFLDEIYNLLSYSFLYEEGAERQGLRADDFLWKLTFARCRRKSDGFSSLEMDDDVGRLLDTLKLDIDNFRI